jgi:hypothetical protein
MAVAGSGSGSGSGPHARRRRGAPRHHREAGDDPAHSGDWVHVAVAHGGHRHQDPVEGVEDAHEGAGLSVGSVEGAPPRVGRVLRPLARLELAEERGREERRESDDQVPCTGYAQAMHRLCTGYAQAMHRLCTRHHAMRTPGR